VVVETVLVVLVVDQHHNPSGAVVATGAVQQGRTCGLEHRVQAP
jgi:hypothetical protein